MKKIIGLLLAACLIAALAACGAPSEAPAAAPAETPAAPAQEQSGEWTRAGYYTDDSDNLISVTWMEDIVDPGWYVGAMIGEFMGGCTVEQEGDTLHGDLNGWVESAEPFVVTLSEEGEDGLLLVVEGGGSYHFKPLEMPEATIFVSVNTEGWGNIAWTKGAETPEIDPDYPCQSAQINLAEPEEHTFLAWPQAGNFFVKWMKNGEDFSTVPQITVLLDESADFVAVFEADPDWQNPVMNFIGEYQCGSAQATVSCFGNDEAWITIDWQVLPTTLDCWDIVGRLDTETLTIAYDGCTEQLIVYDDKGEVEREEVTEGLSGTITFHDDGSFTWHQDQTEGGEDMRFEWVPVTEDEVGAQLANPWREVSENEAKALCPGALAVPEGAENAVWRVMEAGEAPLVQLSFELYELSFTAREQRTGDAEADISGMYYDWTYQMDDTLRNWPGVACRSYRWIGDEGWADLCAWYDAEAGVSYSLSVTAKDLDGFDLLAIAEMLHG